MFVSSMLKKCVNLLSHDFSKSSLKKEVENGASSHLPLDATQVLNKENEELSGSATSIIHNRNLGEVPTDENPILRLECNSVIDSNNIINPDENIETTYQLLANKPQHSICLVHQETVISNVQNGNVTEISTGEKTEDFTVTVEYKSEDAKSNAAISVNEEENTNDKLVENDSQPDACCTSEEHLITVNDSIHSKNSSGNSSFNNSDSCSENVDNDSNNLTLNVATGTVNLNTTYFSSEPSLTHNIECSKIINIEDSIHCVNSENQIEGNVGDQDINVVDVTENLDATVLLSSEIANSFNVDVDYNINDDEQSGSGLDIKKLTFSETDIPISVNETEDVYTENSVRLRGNLESESVSVNHRSISDTEITKEELTSTAITIINENGNSKTMAELSDKDINLEEQISELKLQLNASQQVRASLELQLTQKEEVIIKSQTEALRKQQSYKQEIRQLKEKLEEKNSEDDNTPIKELQETNKSLKLREAKLLSELNARKNDEQNYRKIMDEFEKTIGTQVSELEKLNEEHSVVKRHLATLELAFSDVLQKYDRSKKIIEGFKCNEDALRQSLAVSEDNIIKSEQKYESLKAHAKAQIEKCNQEILLIREQYDSEIHKLTAIVKRLEIKNASLTDSLDQKIKECSALAALCDEVTGKV